MLDAPMFGSRWRWNATRALAVLRARGGKKVPTPLQRMDAEDLVAAVFPDQLACPENLVGDREIPDHPLVQQTIADCLLEAMDFPGLKRVRSAARGLGNGRGGAVSGRGRGARQPCCASLDSGSPPSGCRCWRRCSPEPSASRP